MINRDSLGADEGPEGFDLDDWLASGEPTSSEVEAGTNLGGAWEGFDLDDWLAATGEIPDGVHLGDEAVDRGGFDGWRARPMLATSVGVLAVIAVAVLVANGGAPGLTGGESAVPAPATGTAPTPTPGGGTPTTGGATATATPTPTPTPTATATTTPTATATPTPSPTPTPTATATATPDLGDTIGDTVGGTGDATL